MKRFGKGFISAVLCAAMLMPQAAYAASDKESVFVPEPGNPYDEATWSRLKDNVLEYDEIGLLVEEYNTTLKNLRETYEENKNASDNIAKVKDNLLASSGALLEQAGFLTDSAAAVKNYLGYQPMVTPSAYAGMVYGSELLNYQAEQILLMGDSLSEITPEMMHLQVVDTGRAGLVSGAQSAMIGYEQLLLSKESLESTAELLQAVLRSTETQAAVGLATANDVLSARQNLESVQAGMLTIQANEQKLRQTLCTLLGWEYDARPEIMPVPKADESRIAAMNLPADQEKAIANNFTIRYNVLSLDTLTDGSVEKENMRRTIAGQEAQAASAMVNLYNDVFQKQSELKTAKAAYELEQTKMAAADRKMAAGTIGRLEYLQQQNAVKTKEIEYKNAELALFQSMETYDWALKGSLSLS